MATFKYQALTPEGTVVKGVIEGYDRLDAAAKIRQSYPIVEKLEEVSEIQGLLNMELDANRLNKKAFVLMCSQFAIILKSGIPIGRTIALIADKMSDKKLKKLLKSVSEDVEGGRSLTSSFEAHGGKFLPVTFIETIRAGEESGNLPRAFETIYQHYDKQEKISKKVKNALIYPTFVLVVAVVVVIVLMVKVVPVFNDIFASYGSDLPAITRSLIAVSGFFSKSWWLLLLLIAAVVLGLKLYSGTEKGLLQLGELKLKLPVLGNILSLTACSEFANNMCTLVGSGLPITRAVRVTSKVMSNPYLSAKVSSIVSRIEEGRSLGESLRESEAMPDIMVDMVSVGEETGELETTLDTVAGYYDAELDSTIQASLAKLEPSILVFVAGVAGYIVIAVYVAMFKMYAVM